MKIDSNFCARQNLLLDGSEHEIKLCFCTNLGACCTFYCAKSVRIKSPILRLGLKLCSKTLFVLKEQIEHLFYVFQKYADDAKLSLLSHQWIIEFGTQARKVTKLVRQKKDITIIKGRPSLLLIAPHGVAAKPKDDINTDQLTYKTAMLLKCSAIVNDVFRRKDMDFNSVRQASKHHHFLAAIREIVDAPGLTLVVWIHGIGSYNLARETAAMGVKDQVQCLIGYGQPDRPTAEKKTIIDIIRLLNANSIVTCPAGDGSNYGGHSRRYMNQWFKQNRYKLTTVQSVQLEFCYQGIRRSEDLDAASKKIANAFSALALPI